MTKSCVAIWVDKIEGDFERYSTAVSDEMSQASSKLSKSIQCKHFYTCAHYGFSVYLYKLSVNTFFCCQPFFFLVKEVIINSIAVVKV